MDDDDKDDEEGFMNRSDDDDDREENGDGEFDDCEKKHQLCGKYNGFCPQSLIICTGGGENGLSLLSRLPVWAGRRKDRSASAEAQDMINKIKHLKFVCRDFSPPPASPRKHMTGTNPFAGSRKINRCLTNTHNEAFEDDILPLAAPQESLSNSVTQLSSDNFAEKIEGLKIAQALAIHHSHVLLGKQHDISVTLEQEVQNLRSIVAREAIRTIRLLHRHLGMIMDPEASRTGPVLLRKLAANSCNFIHCEINLALDELVKGCSRRTVLSALLPVGLKQDIPESRCSDGEGSVTLGSKSRLWGNQQGPTRGSEGPGCHRCVAVRECTARHLHQLAEIVGIGQILSAEKWFAETFLAAVIEMCLDAPHEVRFYGQKLLQGLSTQREFPSLFSKLPDKDRHALERIQRKNGF